MYLNMVEEEKSKKAKKKTHPRCILYRVLTILDKFDLFLATKFL
jgi:hypothetical protein